MSKGRVATCLSSDSRLRLGEPVFLELDFSQVLWPVFLQMDSVGSREQSQCRRKEKELFLRNLWDTWKLASFIASS